MPIYEYVCGNCRVKFSKLRPMSKADAPAACTQCGHETATRAVSLFAAVSRAGNGESRHISGTGGGCGSCGGGHCGTCNH